ncbi:MAG TPA: 7TM diverse intracellular signaling domain-containing protein, partial [Candidatus Acidoferrales bacterium]|nr:7TM diverse intracellular signaling domain-containing protein [Candidatus Acidoferrales bacterium]
MRRLVLTLVLTALGVVGLALILDAPVNITLDGTVDTSIYAGDAAHATLPTVKRAGARWVPLSQAPPGNVRWLKLHLNVVDYDDRYVIQRTDFIPEASFQAIEDGRLIDIPAGSLVPLLLRPLPAILPTFDVPVEAVRGEDVYIREVGGPPAPYRVLTVADYSSQNGRERLFFGLYFGILIAVGVYHLLMFSVLGGVDFLSYGLWIVTLVCLQLARTHYVETLIPSQALDPKLTTWLAFGPFAYASYWLV